MKKYLKKFNAAVIFSAFGLFTLLFFAPLEVYLGNLSDFQISIDLAVLILAAVALMATVVFSVLISLLPVKVLKIVNFSIFGVSVCYYVQSLFLNGAMSILTGEKLDISLSIKILNTIIWLVIVSVVFTAWAFFKKKRKEKGFITATKFFAIALIVMQLTGFLSMYLKSDKTANEAKTAYYSIEGQLEVSNKNNVIYFVVDHSDTKIVNEALKEDPTMFEDFKGFTYYADNVFTHSRSFPAITYMLSGEKFYFDHNYVDYVNNSVKNSNFLKSIDAMGTDIRLYTDPRFAGTKSKELVDNCKTATNSLSDVNIKGFVCQSIKISAFRGMPYIFKSRFAYDTDTVNDKSIIRRNDYAPISNDPVFYSTILSEKVSVNEDYSSAFRFYHMFGSHPGAVINENGEYEQNVTLQQALRGDLKIIKTYLEQLKEMGAYDNSTIIITADHGEFNGYLGQPQTCLLLVKERGADSSKPMKTSYAPVCQEDLFATVIKAFGGNYEEFGTALTDIPENLNRKRYHYNTEVDMSTGYEKYLREYVIEGTASDIKNYRKTGKFWEVKSSISPH